MVRQANPYSRGALVEQLDAMLLGAAEVDLAFNVKVTTGSSGVILSGSDTAEGARLAIVTTRPQQAQDVATATSRDAGYWAIRLDRAQGRKPARRRG
jgi:citrate lyase alpha subunit